MRHQWFGLRKLLRNKRVVALMYHRVATLDSDPWELAVNPANFELQIAHLKRKYNILSVDELAYQLQKGKISSDSICVTFDDGYKDNYEVAKPILEKYNCPATFFIATSYLENQQPYWWDELERIILHSPKLPATLEITINGEQFYFEIENDGWLSGEQKQLHRHWTWQHEPPTRRCDAYLTIWEKLKPLSYSEIQKVLESIKNLVIQELPIDNSHFPMTMNQLGDLAKHPLFTIGLHTHTHMALKFHNKEKQLSDIITNKQQLETFLNRTIHTFSYPYGLYDDNTISIANELKLQTAFTTNPKFITKYSPSFKLGRVPVQNIDGATLVNQVSRFFM